MSSTWWGRIRFSIFSSRRPNTERPRSWWGWPSRVPRKFEEDDYLYRLAQQTISFLGSKTTSSEVKERIRELLRSYGIGEDLVDPIQTHALAEWLSSSAKLQQRISFRVDYTPSRWLVEREIGELRKLRNLRHDPPDEKISFRDYPYDWMHENSVSGLCFSGGGIRSATFNLGILQGLAELKDGNGRSLLERFDYLSTVSGGGYIHEWLAAWIKRRGLGEVEKELIPLPDVGCPDFHPAPLRWLRRYSNYLTPRKGMFSADIWVAGAVWLRNTFLNQLVLVSALVVLMLIPHLLVGYGARQEYDKSGGSASSALSVVKLACASIPSTGTGSCGWLFRWTESAARRISHEKPMQTSPRQAVSAQWFYGMSHRPWVLAIVSSLLFLVAIAVMAASLRAANAYSQSSCGTARRGRWAGGGQGAAIGIVCLLLMSAVSVSRLVLIDGQWLDCNLAIYQSVYLLLLFANISVAIAGGTVGAFEFLNATNSANVSTTSRISFWLQSFGGLVFFFSAVASVAATVLFACISWLLCCVLPNWIPTQAYGRNPWQLAIVFAPPLFLGVPFFSQVLLAGLIGRDFADWLREWLARVRAWSLLIGLAWMMWFGLALFGHPVVSFLLSKSGAIKWSVVGAWILTTAGSVLAGKSGKATGTAQDSAKVAPLLNVLAVVGPYVFIFGLTLLLAWVTDTALVLARVVDAARSDVLHYVTHEVTIALYALPLIVFVLFGWRVDINEFSMHAFYRNRLSRCYLGASNAERKPNPLTGFDECDVKGMELSSFRPPEGGKTGYEGPFPIFCSALNLAFGQDLAWQDRKAVSFAFTPLYSGYHVGWTVADTGTSLSYNGYVPTKCYAYPGGGINIATAVAISGAAVSPSWGYHTNPATAFLMTMFNARLGWWLRNPRTSKLAGCGDSNQCSYDPSERSSPALPAFQLGREMLGMVDDSSEFVYLTDGGHFENMGLYELIRRRCRYIVVCDSEEDHDYCFGGISTAVRRCRVDFGVSIDLNLLPLRPQMDAQLGYRVSKQHFVVGTIRYPERSSKKAEEQGTILYIKSSLTGQQPTFANCANLPPEPADVVNHKLRHGAYPNDTTANQWFDEETFESYRHLGLHISDEVAKCGAWKQLFG